MNVVCIVQVFNEEKFLDICLSKIINYAHKIIIVDGAVEFFWPIAGPNGESTDQTIRIIKDWMARYPEKFDYVPSKKWVSKNDMQYEALNLIPPNTDYIHIVDADEHYTEDELEKILNELEDKKPHVAKVRFKHWGQGGEVITRGIFGVPIARLFKWQKGFKFATGTMNQPASGIYPANDNCIVIDAVCEHYGHIDPVRDKAKADYYEFRQNKWRAGQYA